MLSELTNNIRFSYRHPLPTARSQKILIKLHWLLSSQFGFDPQRFLRSLRGLPAFVSDWRQYRKSYHGKLVWMPCLHDRFEEGGATRNEYFWQDLLVARWICEKNPEKHVDIGSRVDGFVAHVASFRQIEVLDVRPITTVIPGVVFRQAELMDPASLHAVEGCCDSLSCLHALEHFGLGRYGDPINPQGYEQGIANMSLLLRPEGTLYLSTPVGNERVEFNANRVFDPRSIIRCAAKNGMKLDKLFTVTADNGPQASAIDDAALAGLAAQRYQLGMFIFTKTTLGTDVQGL